MTIQSILSQYPNVEKAFKLLLAYEWDTSDYLYDHYHFNTLKGHVEAFFRGYNITFCIVEDNIMGKLYFCPEWCLFNPEAAGYEKELKYFTVPSNTIDYETAFLSALTEACKYLEPKLKTEI